jgi:hypothetical protein
MGIRCLEIAFILCDANIYDRFDTGVFGEIGFEEIFVLESGVVATYDDGPGWGGHGVCGVLCGGWSIVWSVLGR